MVLWLKGLAAGFGAGVVTMLVVSFVSSLAQNGDRARSQVSEARLAAGAAVAQAVEQSDTSKLARVQGLAPESPSTSAPAFLDPPPSSEALPEEPAHSRRAQELAAIDAVRAALIAKNPQAALAQLDRYELNYPQASFGLPAQLLRIEALAVSGRPQAAMELASAFVAAHPDSLHAARLRAFAAGEALSDRAR